MIVRGLYVLAAIVTAVILYYAFEWVFRILGIAVPERLLVAVMVLYCILAIIGALTGRYDNWWGPPKA